MEAILYKCRNTLFTHVALVLQIVLLHLLQMQCNMTEGGFLRDDQVIMSYLICSFKLPEQELKRTDVTCFLGICEKEEMSFKIHLLRDVALVEAWDSLLILL